MFRSFGLNWRCSPEQPAKRRRGRDVERWLLPCGHSRASLSAREPDRVGKSVLRGSAFALPNALLRNAARDQTSIPSVEMAAK